PRSRTSSEISSRCCSRCRRPLLTTGVRPAAYRYRSRCCPELATSCWNRTLRSSEPPIPVHEHCRRGRLHRGSRRVRSLPCRAQFATLDEVLRHRDELRVGGAARVGEEEEGLLRGDLVSLHQ